MPRAATNHRGEASRAASSHHCICLAQNRSTPIKNAGEQAHRRYYCNRSYWFKGMAMLTTLVESALMKVGAPVSRSTW